MPVTLITQTERLKWTSETYEGASLFYRRPTSAFQRQLRAEHTAKGIIDEGAFFEALIQWAVTGWEGIQDASGNIIEFDKDLVPQLPEAFKAEFVAALFKVDPKGDELGN